MKQEFYKTDLGIVIKDNNSIRLKSSYVKKELSENEFLESNPLKMNKRKYLESINNYFRESKFSWTHKNTKFRRMDNFEISEFGTMSNYNFSDIPKHKISSVLDKCIIVLYRDRIYYGLVNGNYYPKIQLINFHTKELTGKWTSIKNLAPIFNITDKKII